MPELRELTLRMKSISNSENQIAKRVNSTGNLYEVDIEEIKKNQEEFMRASEICRKPAVLSVFRQRTVTRYKSCASLPLEHTKLDFKSKYRDCTEQLVEIQAAFFCPNVFYFRLVSKCSTHGRTICTIPASMALNRAELQVRKAPAAPE